MWEKDKQKWCRNDILIYLLCLNTWHCEHFSFLKKINLQGKNGQEWNVRRYKCIVFWAIKLSCRCHFSQDKARLNLFILLHPHHQFILLSSWWLYPSILSLHGPMNWSVNKEISPEQFSPWPIPCEIISQLKSILEQLYSTHWAFEVIKGFSYPLSIGAFIFALQLNEL